MHLLRGVWYSHLVAYQHIESVSDENLKDKYFHFHHGHNWRHQKHNKKDRNYNLDFPLSPNLSEIIVKLTHSSGTLASVVHPYGELTRSLFAFWLHDLSISKDNPLLLQFKFEHGLVSPFQESPDSLLTRSLKLLLKHTIADWLEVFSGDPWPVGHVSISTIILFTILSRRPSLKNS